METKSIFKRLAIILVLAIMPVIANAQSMVTEIRWNSVGATQSGLLVLWPNNQGILRVHAYVAGVGEVWVQENAVLNNQYDYYGNCTSYIVCNNPVTAPYVPWAADNFVVFPNGNMYTQDAAGNWSTQIVAQVVPQYLWQSKFIEYGFN